MKKVVDTIMGMPITVEVLDSHVTLADIDEVFDYFRHIDAVFSTYKQGSEISRINRNQLALENSSREMQEIFSLAAQTSKLTDGYFSIGKSGQYDPSGIVKGWAIEQASKQLVEKGFSHYFIEAGGDIQVSGRNGEGEPWQIGIRNPFKPHEVVKVVYVTTEGVATSGTYERGNHIYNPKTNQPVEDILSLTVIGPTIYEADCFATAAFAMGDKGIYFLEEQPQLEAYMIDNHGTAIMTSGFERYVKGEDESY